MVGHSHSLVDAYHLVTIDIPNEKRFRPASQNIVFVRPNEFIKPVWFVSVEEDENTGHRFARALRKCELA